MAKRKKRIPPPESGTWSRFEPVGLEGIDSWKKDILRGAWANNLYEVKVYDGPIVPGWPPLLMLSIGRRDREAIHDWRHFQRIKNELVGAEHEAIELYPKESRLMDAGNRYWLFALAEEDAQFPFGLEERVVLGPNPAGSQRPFDSVSPPSDTVSFEQHKQMFPAAERPPRSEPSRLAQANAGRVRTRPFLSIALFILSNERNLKRVLLGFGFALFLAGGALLILQYLR